MKPGSIQQALAGLAALLITAVTLLGGVILALGDSARIGERSFAPSTATLADQQTATLLTSSASSTLSADLPTRTPAATLAVIPTSTDIPATPTVEMRQETALPNQCEISARGAVHIVNEGETLSTIAEAFGITLDALMQANCLSSSRIRVGDALRIPQSTERSMLPPGRTPSGIPEVALPTPRPGPTGTQTATDGACTNADSIITSPGVGAHLRGVVEFRGTARVPGFAFYKLEIRQEGKTDSPGYLTFYTGNEMITNGVLGVLDTQAWPNGEYWIRLVVVDGTGNYPERCAILYVFAN